MDLTQKICVACKGGIPPLTLDEIKPYMESLKTPWELIENNTKIRHLYKFEDFKEAMIFVNKVAEIANHEGHHPDIFIHYNKVTIELYTHAIGGLHENDFIVAAKIEQL